jgi:CO/xanthine dehydrogenase FAD-binding subunit
VAQRLPLLEQALAGLRAAADIDACVQPAQLAGLAPLDDVRAGRTYRLDAALTLVRRTLREALAAA